MDRKFGFTRMTPVEFQSWIASQSIARTILRVQQHHTYRPDYSTFTGSNHFEMQRNMQRYHVNHNGWNDIGQHFSIFPDGMIVTGRNLNSTPACISRANSGAVCIENVGYFDAGHDTMSSAQAASIFKTTAALLKKIGVSSANETNVVYHHWYDGLGNLKYHGTGQKSCPGTAFFGGNQLSDFKANFLPKLQAEMGGGGTAPAGLAHWARVTADSLNIRKGASSSEGLITEQGPLQYGSVIRIYQTKSNGWVRISQSKQHWVYGRYTQVVTPKVVNTANSNARLGAGMGFDVARVYQTGDRVFVGAVDGDWRQIEDDTWIHKSLLN